MIVPAIASLLTIQCALAQVYDTTIDALLEARVLPFTVDNFARVASDMGERKDDGSMTVHPGGCEDGRANCLPIMEGWKLCCSSLPSRPQNPRSQLGIPSVPVGELTKRKNG